MRFQDGTTIRNYTIQGVVGLGTFATVYGARSSMSQNLYAMKVCHNRERVARLSKDEVAVLLQIMKYDPERKRNCVSLLDHFNLSDGSTCLVLPLLGRSLASFLRHNDGLPFPKAHVQKITYQLLEALAFLHSIGIVHRDVQSDNILLRTNGFFTSSYTMEGRPEVLTRNVLYDPKICLCGFGIAKIINGQKQTNGVCGPYIAPEVCLRLPWDYSVDVDAAGLLIQELALGQPIIPPGASAVVTLALLHAFKGQLPERLAKHAQRETQIPFKSVKTDSVLLFKRTSSQIDFEKLGLDRSKIMRLAIRSRQIDMANATDMNVAAFVDLKDKLMEYDPATRMKAKDALKHHYFTGARFAQPTLPI